MAQQTVQLISFGFKHGMPEAANIMLDVRFLQNPYWVPSLKGKSGLDGDVGAYISEDSEFAAFIERAAALIAPLLPKFSQEALEGFTIAIGCTGGRHRSVYAAERLAHDLRGQNIHVSVKHRDLEKLDK